MSKSTGPSLDGANSRGMDLGVLVTKSVTKIGQNGDKK